MVKKLVKKEIRLLTDTGNAEKFEMITDENKLARSTQDPKMLCCEIYNNSGFDILIQSQLPKDFGTQYQKVICKNDEFKFMPHQYFVLFGLEKGSQKLLPNGTPLQILINFGDNMFKGNKKASVPTSSIY